MELVSNGKTFTKAAIHDGDPQWRVDPGTKHSRFRGRGSRGRQPREVVDAHDLGCALRTLSTATEALVLAHGRVIPSQRRAEVAAAVSMLALATRMIDEVIIRRGGTPADCEADEDGR